MAFKAPPPKFNFKLPDPGFHRGVLTQLIDLGIQPSSNPKFQPGPMVAFVFELPDVKRDDGSPETVQRKLGLSMGKKAKLRLLIEGWFGKSFPSDDAARNFDFETLVGRAAYVQIVHETKGDRTYANITALAPLPTGIEKPKPSNGTVIFQRDRPDANEVYRSLPEYLQKIIDQALPEEQAEVPPAEAAATEAPAGADDDEAIPF